VQIVFWAGMCVFVPLGLVGTYLLAIRQ
jgi:hypothetical protein